MADLHQFWLDQSAYDLETAEAMLKSARYLYVLFCCQQAVEKKLKALAMKRTNAFPPRLHQLPRLAEAAGCAIDEQQSDFLRELSSYYVQSRYPEEIAAMGKDVDLQLAEDILKKTREVLQCLQ
jgi:HEPN domain-containing protein